MSRRDDTPLNEVHEVDVCVVAVTNRDLCAQAAAARFGEDLYFRLAVIPIHVPPLRERAEDLLPLTRHFLAHWSADGLEPRSRTLPGHTQLARQRA